MFLPVVPEHRATIGSNGNETMCSGNTGHILILAILANWWNSAQYIV